MSGAASVTPGSTKPPLVLVRATVNLPGLRLGARALVDPTVPYVATALARGLVVPVTE